MSRACESKPMTGKRIILRSGVAFVFFAACLNVAADDFTNVVYAFLQRRVEVEKRDISIVVGLVDEQGMKVVSCGKLENGSDQRVDGDTVFEIGSVTKTFTALLLADMVERGEMKLDDAVAKYLPASAKLPIRNGKEITLLQLATHTSSLPGTSVTWVPKRAENPRADYTIARLYDFASNCKLTRDPGTKYEYSTAGIALLGEAIARTSGTNYEALVQDRICGPLGMESTRVSLPPQLKNRRAVGHNYYGYAVPETYWGALMAGAALRSTANDLLKYIAAQIGMTKSRLTPAIEKTHVSYFNAHMDTETGLETDMGLAWMIAHQSNGKRIVQHGGLTDGFIADVCFDLERRRGVVVLCNSQDFELYKLSKLLLASDWHSASPATLALSTKPFIPSKPCVSTRLDTKSLNAVTGDYAFKPSAAFPAGASFKIRCETDTLVGEATGQNTPQGAFDVFAESETNFFLKINGAQLTFTKDSGGKTSGVIYRSYRGKFPDCEGRRIPDRRN